GIHSGVVGVAAAIGAWADHPDDMHLVHRHADGAGDAILDEVRLLRAGPAGDVAVLDLDQRTGWAHAGMRLERPFVLGLDHACGGAERFLHVAGLLALVLVLARRGLADVIVERRLLYEWRLRVRPFDLERLRGLDRIPFLLGIDGEEALLQIDLGAANVLDRRFVDLHRHGARDGR